MYDPIHTAAYAFELHRHIRAMWGVISYWAELHNRDVMINRNRLGIL